MTTKFDIYSMTKEELCAMAEELGMGKGGLA